MPPLSLITLTETPAAPEAGTVLYPSSLPPAAVEALYVHVPFCFHKCHYCDFYSITRQSVERMERFVDLVLAEAELWTGSDGNPFAGPQLRPRTVFFGGGTPSLLPENAMRRLIEGLRRRIDWFAVDEWTIEVNPATATLEYCEMLREFGVNRLSFGAQSFDPKELKALERHHDPEDVPRSIDLARAAGFERLNLDLIYAIPGQDLASWDRSLSAAVALATPHLSCYGLTYEPNTPIAVKKRLGTMVPVEDSVELEMLHHTRRRLAGNGYSPYEISNYAVDGEACRHNLVYWSGGNYVGLGPSAASHVEGWRWRNRPHLGEWEEAVEAGRLPAADVEHLSPSQRAGELAMLMLRLERGIVLNDFSARTGLDARSHFAATIDRLEQLGLITAGHGAIRLTESGLNVADAVSAEFLSAADSD
jgi:oxygen-independent coproporphyrinogen-3 oxidase